jgi:flagellar biosynthesis protein FlhF
MVTKTFKADSALQTLQLVQAELGANAIVVSMREVPNGPAWNPWKSSSVEVVASLPEQETRPAPTPVLRPSENQMGVEFIEERPEIEWQSESDQQLTDLRNQSHPKLKLNLNSEKRHPSPASSEPVSQRAVSKPGTSEKYVPPVLKKIQQQLINQGVENTLVDGLINLALETLSSVTLGDEEKCRNSFIQLLGAELPVQRGAGKFLTSNVICLIGASGSGKTSSMAKLALYYSQQMNKNIIWICADTVRSGAVAEARAYADALGFGLNLVYVPEDLKELLQAAALDDLFLVDTPGYNPCSETQMIELGSLLEEMPRRCTYLIAPATTKESDLYQLSASLGIFNLNGLIVTKLDETHSFGNVYNFARRNNLPLSYFASGRDASHDLEVADPMRLASALFGREWNK